MPLISTPCRSVMLTPQELVQRLASLQYVCEQLRVMPWRCDPLARALLIRERDHCLHELIKGENLPFGWKLPRAAI